jgi:uncharacterized lipoprotein YbaY
MNRFALFVAASVLVSAFVLGCDSDDSKPSSQTRNYSPPDNGSTASAQETQTVSGHVLLSGDTAGLTFPLTAEVSVLDVTYEDGESTTVGTQTIHIAGAGPTEFAVVLSQFDAKARYTVSVHVDSDGDGKSSTGDFTTQESYPVLNGYPATIDVTAKRF